MLEAGEAIAQSRLHTGFLVSAARYPDRVALSIGQQQWTYAQIEELARRWAAQLIVVTGGQPARIGVLGYKSLTSYVGILASLFAGATYVPLNPNYPVLRTRVMAQQADLNAIIVDERSMSQLPAILDGQSQQSSHSIADERNGCGALGREYGLRGAGNRIDETII